MQILKQPGRESIAVLHFCSQDVFKFSQFWLFEHTGIQLDPVKLLHSRLAFLGVDYGRLVPFIVERQHCHRRLRRHDGPGVGLKLHGCVLLSDIGVYQQVGDPRTHDVTRRRVELLIVGYVH